MKIISRKEAKAQGLKRYFTGKPCKYGHVAERLIWGVCVSCEKGHRRVKAIQQSAKWAAENPERVKAIQRKSYRKHRERRVADSRKWQLDNPERHRQSKAKWQQDNTAHRNAQERRRKADKIQRTPAWADLEAIKFFYECCPAGCHVDRIVPLRGKYVSGLHVAENLQWLSAADNVRKYNTFDTGDQYPWDDFYG